MNDTVLAHHRLKAALHRFSCRYVELDNRSRHQIDADVARAMAMEEAVLQSTEAISVSVPPETLDDALQDIRARYSDEEAFQADLSLNDLSLYGLKAALYRELKTDAVLEKVAAALSYPSEAELHAWYDSHRDRFAAPETRMARHVLVTVNDAYVENRRAEAFARITDLRRQLDGTIASFEQIARRHSECPTAMEGGRLGTVAPGTLYPQLDMALFRLGEGEVSDVLESAVGFHIILCEAVHPARQVPFAEAREKIRTALDNKRRERAKARWLAALMAQPETA
ncbi:nitrogen fixation protein NifM [Martelella endophytica]|uniref:Parvulin-like PPIase n=1 Tax=Martelella endophytica TaxID=1486262 RepID=A0A0D5LS13_MAREN|nr:nitrogen fixation protein NifM [Martelella endophytica]AJY46760.1 hypothetical protein TM49_15525 [Martelella endophytica]